MNFLIETIIHSDTGEDSDILSTNNSSEPN